MKLKKKTGYLLIAKSAKKSQVEQGNLSISFGKAADARPSQVVVFSTQKKTIERGLAALVRRGVTEIFVMPLARFSKKAVQNEIPRTIENFRTTRMFLDFHYAGRTIVRGVLKAQRGKKHDR